MKRSALWLAAVLLNATGCGGGCNQPFVTDSCDTPAAGSAVSLEIGSVESGPFMPWVDGTVAHVVYGSQGGTMIPVALRLRGPDVPGCLVQDTRVLRYTDDALIDLSSSPLRTYAEDDGTRTTKSIYLVMSYDTQLGDAVRIRANAAGQSAELVVFVDHVGSPDAAVPDGGPQDAQPDAAAPRDAAMLDAGPDSAVPDSGLPDAG